MRLYLIGRKKTRFDIRASVLVKAFSTNFIAESECINIFIKLGESNGEYKRYKKRDKEKAE